MQPPFTPQSKMAMSVSDWNIMDSKEIFELHSKKYPQKMQEWKNYSISYRYNSHGFRSEEFSNGGAMFLGCSFTLAEGISVDDRWTTIISKRLDVLENNLGVSGGSGDTCFRLSKYWIPLLKPSYVFLLYPYKHRREEFKNNKLFQLFPRMYKLFPKTLDEPELMEIFSKDKEVRNNYDKDLIEHHINSWLLSEENIDLNLEKNILSIENICNKNNSKLIVMLVDDINDDIKKLDCARDLAHPGIEANKYIANLFLEKMSE